MSNTDAAERFRVALDLAETGVELMRQNLRHRHPAASDVEVAALLAEWLISRPPDAPGRIRQFPAP